MWAGGDKPRGEEAEGDDLSRVCPVSSAVLLAAECGKSGLSIFNKGFIMAGVRYGVSTLEGVSSCEIRAVQLWKNTDLGTLLICSALGSNPGCIPFSRGMPALGKGVFSYCSFAQHSQLQVPAFGFSHPDTSVVVVQHQLLRKQAVLAPFISCELRGLCWMTPNVLKQASQMLSPLYGLGRRQVESFS